MLNMKDKENYDGIICLALTAMSCETNGVRRLSE